MAFHGSYAPQDVTFLLQPKEIEPTPVALKEKLIQSGEKHYSEMLSAEKLPYERYMALYAEALTRNAGRLKRDIELLAGKIAARPENAASCTLISLARAGTPIGVLLRRALDRRGLDIVHYSISIIRGRGIDLAALAHIAEMRGSQEAVFIDGWTGKGAITGELRRSLADHPHGFAPFLAVIADPAGCSDLAATPEDYLIPSGILNGIVSGLVSRSVLNDDLVAPGEFHACQYLEEFEHADLSRQFIDDIEGATLAPGPFPEWSPDIAKISSEACEDLIAALMDELGVDDRNRIKPGIAEATRAILRRVPHAVLIRDRSDPEIEHILHLAAQNGIEVIERDLSDYRAVSIIKKTGGGE